MVANKTLVNIAVYGGVIVSSTGFFLQSRITTRIRNNDYYREALKRLRLHPGAVHYLGEPIKDKTFKITDSENNYCDGETARFKVPVSGPKARGTYHFWATRVDNVWKINRAELELKNEPDRRLVIVKSLD